MNDRSDLRQRVRAWAGKDKARQATAATVLALADAGREIAEVAGRGNLGEPLGAATGLRGPIDAQKRLDVVANDIIADALREAPVAALASEEMEEPLALRQGAPLLVAVDPIDGSSNIDADVTIGTIFSILPAADADGRECGFLQPGNRQLAAGFLVYGPYTSLVLSLGRGVDVFTLDRPAGGFRLTRADVRIPEGTREYALNVANYRYWDEPIRHYLDHCLSGREGPRGVDFNMRWTGSPVAEFYRILSRGGVFIYPADLRHGYAHGRLRLLYEANPFAFIMEQAGGAASNGRERLLDLVPQRLHQHVPVIAGARDEVGYAAELHRNPLAGERSPLFGRRGLFRL